ncbi:hypothetical protein MN033_11025 [Bacillus nitratireducens]|uniref:BRO-N domain-containing protein n=1 Tax=Bacillus nitratireducens TaxID=2026193 RepID=UPI001F587DC0|nr:BRO family protein [Bacillus nitratireducens]UNP78637.1 hypothetical protein MN033_11025 [Bacillus nitratireducens]
MTNLIVVHEQEVLGQSFKVYGTVEEPLFLAKDVAEWIEYSQVNGKYKVAQMLNVVDEDEKLVSTLKSPGKQDREMWFLTENGIYEVLMLSRKPIAKQWKKEVKRILKNIRLNGFAKFDYATLDKIEEVINFIESISVDFPIETEDFTNYFVWRWKTKEAN